MLTTCKGCPEDLSNFGAANKFRRIVTLDGKRRRGKDRSKWAQHVQGRIFHAVIAKARVTNKGVFLNMLIQRLNQERITQTL